MQILPIFHRCKPGTVLLSDEGTHHASNITGKVNSTLIMFMMCLGNIEENDIDLIQFHGVLILSCISKVSKSNIRM